MTRTPQSSPRRWRRGALVACLLLLVACAPRPVERPREGAPPIVGGTPVRIENVPPPTLAAAAALVATPTPSPDPLGSPQIAASPVGSPGLYPIISNLQPAPGASLPAGDVVIGARVSGSSDLTDVIAFVDSEQVQIDLGTPAPRVKVISLIRTLSVGSHEIRIQARDQHGQSGGYRWQFTVGQGRQLTPVPTNPPLPTRTPLPVPTRLPAAKPAAPAPGATPAAAPGAVTPTRPPAR